MEQQKSKIGFYQQRTFTEKLNASVDFIKQNWKPLLKYSTYLILPLCIIQAFLLNKVTDSALVFAELTESVGGIVDDSLLASFIVNYVLVFLFLMIGALLMTAVIYSLMQIYNESEEGLNGLTFEQLKPYLFRNMKRYLIVILFLFLLVTVYMIALGVFAVLSLYTLILTIPAMIVLAVPLAYLTPVYLFEKIKIGDATTKSFTLGFPTWGGIFGVSFVMGLIASILQGVLMLPWYVATMVKFILGMSDVGGELALSSDSYSIVLYFLGIISIYGSYISMVFVVVGISYQYAHANEKVTAISVVDDIDNFEQL